MQTNSDSAELDRLIHRSIDQSLNQSDARKLNLLLEASTEAVHHYNKIHETHAVLFQMFPGSQLQNTPLPQSYVLRHDSDTPKQILPSGKSCRYRCSRSLLSLTLSSFMQSLRASIRASSSSSKRSLFSSICSYTLSEKTNRFLDWLFLHAIS